MPHLMGSSRTIDEIELRRLLQMALDLMSLYAYNLNKIDGGSRKIYKTIDGWKADAGTE